MTIKVSKMMLQRRLMSIKMTLKINLIRLNQTLIITLLKIISKSLVTQYILRNLNSPIDLHLDKGSNGILRKKRQIILVW